MASGVEPSTGRQGKGGACVWVHQETHVSYAPGHTVVMIGHHSARQSRRKPQRSRPVFYAVEHAAGHNSMKHQATKKHNGCSGEMGCKHTVRPTVQYRLPRLRPWHSAPHPTHMSINHTQARKENAGLAPRSSAAPRMHTHPTWICLDPARPATAGSCMAGQPTGPFLCMQDPASLGAARGGRCPGRPATYTPR